MREDIPDLFGEEFNPGNWNWVMSYWRAKRAYSSGHLNKQGKTEDHRYAVLDRRKHLPLAIAKCHNPSSKRGREIIEHKKDGRKIHLFVRKTTIRGESRAVSVLWPVDYVSHQGSEPMSESLRPKTKFNHQIQ
jgi:hypothetical protein